MPDSLTDLLVKGTTLVTSGRVAARQIEGYVARRHLAEGHTAWLAPEIRTHREWAADTWRSYLDDGRRQLLSGGQVDALWRRVIEASPAPHHRFLAYRHAFAWAREASRRRRDWNIGLDELRGFGSDPDCRALLHWEQAYRNAMDESGWMDSADVDEALRVNSPSLSPGSRQRVVWAQLTPPPALVRLRQRLQGAGHRFAEWNPPQTNQRCRRVQLPEAVDEVRAAAAWAAEKLGREPRQRLAIVVPGLENRGGEVASILEDTLSPARSRLEISEDRSEIVFLQGGSSAIEAPVIGAALSALELFTDSGSFQVLSRWLRSPFFIATAGEAEARSILETQLRAHISSQLGFLDAFNSGALAARIQAASPVLAETLGEAAALMRSQPRRATPSHWAGVWRRLLNNLGWHGGTVDSTASEEWESALNELALLTPILGRLRLGDALAELEGILGRPHRHGAIPLYGVFVLAEPEDVGPGYDALWACGLSDTQWPRAPQPDPLLPLAVQRAHGMPSASPSASLEQSRLVIRRLVEGVDDVVLSSPEIVREHSAQPSPLILSYPVVSATDLVGGPSRGLRPTLLGGSHMEICSDPVPPVANRELRGGVRTLSMQSVCPLRAFVENRLCAGPLETVRSGLNARQRGIAAHAAAQRLLSEQPGQQDLAMWTAAERAQRIDDSSHQALSDLFGPALHRLRPLFKLESARLRSMLAGLLELDLDRTAFQVLAVEQSIRVTVAGLQLKCRIDRIDQLDGTDMLAIVDYKTGSGHTPGDWLKERPRDLQLPLYAALFEGEVTAVAIAMLRPQKSAYKGIWSTTGQFPGRSARLPDSRTWATQRERWRAQVEDLAREFAAGDGRVFLGDLKIAAGSFASVTRIHELAALARLPCS